MSKKIEILFNKKNQLLLSFCHFSHNKKFEFHTQNLEKT